MWACWFTGLAVVLGDASYLCAAEPSRQPPTILHHQLTVELVPDRHELLAQDRMEVAVGEDRHVLVFTLAPTLQVSALTLGDVADGSQPLTWARRTGPDAEPSQVMVTLPAAHPARVRLHWSYRGTINDPPQEPRHLRFVTPSETSGHIGPEGVYVSSETRWYPDMEGSLSTFGVTARTPREWMVVTQGRQEADLVDERGRVSTWRVGERAEALTLVANRFVLQSREWTGRDGRTVRLATYLFPEDAALANEYLDATAAYLDVYVPLLGPYPFQQFAVVENFFASGLGMPSFTLLGSGSIKRHYTQPYALGHEIVHSWIGNAVWNRPESGNWVEGLTTYLANYYWHEQRGDQVQARDQRRLMLQGYSLYVAPAADYPVAAFQRKSDERDNAIGYHKSALVFHQLRQVIGEAAFWGGLKQAVAELSGQHADWHDLERLFARVSRMDLRWFFAQWVEQAGAPQVFLAETSVQGSGGSYRLQLTLRQEGTPVRMTVPVEVTRAGGTETVLVPMAGSHSEYAVELPELPTAVSLDPQFMALRRLARTQIAPVLNLYVTDERRAVLPLFSEDMAPFQDVVARIQAQEAALPAARRSTVLPVDTAALPEGGSVLILATAEHHAHVQALITKACGGRVTLEPGGFRVDGAVYEGPSLAVLFSCHHPGVPGSVVTVLYTVHPGAAMKPARLLFFYGWQSLVIFTDGAVARRDVWQAPQASQEVRVNGQP